jgi:uncharacterized protein (DUF433 family)
VIVAVQHRAEDVRDLPAYTYPEASRALSIPASTLGAWTRGQTYRNASGEARQFSRVIQRPEHDTRLSYFNLIEAHVLRALRTVHDFSLSAVREALDVAEQEFGIERLLIHEDFRYEARNLFLRRYGQLVTLTKGQQIAMEHVLEIYLHRVEYGSDRLPFKLYPLTRGEKADDSPRIIVLDPHVSFGRPVVERLGISSRAIVSRINAGEEPAHVQEDYGLSVDEFEEAILFESTAA